MGVCVCVYKFMWKYARVQPFSSTHSLAAFRTCACEEVNDWISDSSNSCGKMCKDSIHFNAILVVFNLMFIYK